MRANVTSFKYRAGIIRSVSMSLPLMGTAVPAIFVILTISLMVPRLLILAHVDNLAVQSRRGDHRRTHEQGAAPWAPLAPDEVTVRRRSGNFAAIQLVGIHRETHGATCLTPFEAGFLEDLVQAFPFGKFFNLRRTRNYQSANPGLNLSTFRDLCGRAQVGHTGVCTRADEGDIDRRAEYRSSRLPSHMLVSFSRAIWIRVFLRLRKFFRNAHRLPRIDTPGHSGFNIFPLIIHDVVIFRIRIGCD